MMEATGNYLETNGGKLYYEVAGEGQPLVLLHGMMFDTRLWDDMMPALTQRHKVIRYDARGWGRSHAEDLSVDDTDDLLALLDHLNIERAAVVGVSMGSGIVFSFMGAHPERVVALIMVSGGVIGYDDESSEAEERFAQFFVAARAGDYAQAIDIFSEVWVDGIAPASDEVRRRAREIMGDYSFAHYKQPQPDSEAKAETGGDNDEKSEDEEQQPTESYEDVMRPKLAAMTVPTLLVAGDRDQPSEPKAARATAAAIPGAQLVIIEGAAHNIPLEKPTELAELILDFLARRT